MGTDAKKPRILIPYRDAEKVKPYVEAVRAGGAEAITVLTKGSVRLEGFDGLLLMGGTDVNPRLYGESAQAETQQPDEERDAVELALIGEAMEKDLPILAICRGMQILNVQQGGTLIQHLASTERHRKIQNKAEPVHEVTIEPESLLARIAGSERWQVNSRHHQAVGKVGAGLRVSARDSEDGTLEGLERPDKRFVVAVQWHPEDQIELCPEQLKLFRAFAGACNSRTGQDS